MTGLRVEGLTKTYRGGKVRALDGVSLEIQQGEAFGIIGPNGAGKTTLLSCLLGFLRPDAGSISIAGLEPDDLAIRRQTGYLPERVTLDRWMSGRAFIRYHLGLAGLPVAAADEALERVGLSPEAGTRAIRKYSRGMLQRLGFAQAILGEPRWLFLDEPASGVDPEGVLLFRAILAELKERGTTLILNSHQLAEVERVCDRVAFVRAGRVEAIEPVEAGAELERVLRVRVAGDLPLSDEALATLAASAGARLVARSPLRFAVPSDAEAAALLGALVGAELAVVEAVSEQSGLERLFKRGGGAP